MKCPKCQTDNPYDSKFCKECATPITRPEVRQVSVTRTLETPKEPIGRGTLFAGRYEIIEALGAGGMGEVYRVEDKKVGQEVALKLIKPEVASNKRAVERFRQELITARMISHRNVCRMFDLGEDKGTYFITMEYVPGEDLRSFLRRSKHLSITTAVDIAKQIAEGLAEAHRLGVVHRDLKPGNVMIDEDGNARIMDFGIARLLSAKGITGAGVAVGTPDYMSPEQVEGKETDQRADIYALGIILYEMVIGRIPFEADTALAVGYKHKHEAPVNPKVLNPQTPEDLSGLILKCLEKEPDKRFQTADELRGELEKIEKGLSTTTATTPAPKRTPLTSREITIKFTAKKLLIPGLPIIAGIAAVILAFIFLPRRTPPPKTAPIHKQVTFTGNASEPAISPDGKFLAFSDSISLNEQKLMIQDLAGGQAIEVFRGKRLSGKRWSPDGSELTFTDQTGDSGGATYIVPRLGGKPRQIAGVYYAVWSSDGSGLLNYSYEKKQFQFIDKKTGESRAVPLDLPPTVEEFDLSPSGKFIVLSLIEGQKISLWIVRADGRSPNKIFGNENWVSSPRWSPRGDAVYYLLDSGQKLTECMKMPISPDTGKVLGPPSRILEGREIGGYFTLTNDGRYMFYALNNEVTHIWSAALEGSGKEQKVEIKQLTKGTMRNAQPSLSPDGKLIAYASGSGDAQNIYVMPAEGGPTQQITFMDSNDSAPVWSPDGKEIAFSSSQGGTSKIWKVSAAGGRPHEFAKSEGFWPSWAPGRQILYQPLEDSNLLFIDPVTEVETPLFETKPEGNPHWPINSPDGRRALTRWYKSPSESMGIWIIPRDGSPGIKLREGNLIPIGWSADGKWVYTQESVPGGLDIIAFSTESGEARVLFKVLFNAEMGKPTGRGHTVDGKHFVTACRRIQSDIWVMENFDPEIK